MLSLDLAPGIDPRLDTASQGQDVAVSHLTHRVGCKRGAISACAIENDFPLAWHHPFDAPFERPARDVHRAGHVAEVPLAILAYIDDGEVLPALAHLEDFAGTHFASAFLRFFEELMAGFHRLGAQVQNSRVAPVPRA